METQVFDLADGIGSKNEGGAESDLRPIVTAPKKSVHFG
jgi:hypothetical protein